MRRTFSPTGLGQNAPSSAGCAGSAKGRSTVKVAPAPGTLVTPIRPAHLVDQALGDGKPEARAAAPPRRSRLGLLELRENALDRIGSNAPICITRREA
jgi:hypothetical protein